MDGVEINPLMPLAARAKVFAAVFVLVFWVANIAALFLWSPASFQRLGSIWVAFLLISFGMLRYTLSALNEATNGRGPFAALATQKLAPITNDEEKGRLNHVSQTGIQYSEPLPKMQTVHEYVKEIEQEIVQVIVPKEISLAAIATLQWGYGDLFHCWVNGNGWSTCSS